MLETNLWQVDKFRFSTLDFAFLQHLYQLHYSPNSKYNGLRGMPSTKYYEGVSKKIPAIFPRSWQRTIPLVLLTNTFKSGFPYLIANLLVRVHVISSIRFILGERFVRSLYMRESYPYMDSYWARECFVGQEIDFYSSDMCVDPPPYLWRRQRWEPARTRLETTCNCLSGKI